MKLSFGALAVLLTALFAHSPSQYPHRVGYIPKNTGETPNPNFKVCNEEFVLDYYNKNGVNDKAAGYIGGPKAIRQLLKKDYPELDLKNASGMITIRFIINCKGETGRFMVIENDLDFKPKTFKPEVRNTLLSITQKLDQWRPSYLMDENRDCAMYITYKIDHGKIIAILP